MLRIDALQEPSLSKCGPGRSHEATGEMLRTQTVRDGSGTRFGSGLYKSRAQADADQGVAER